MFPPVGELESPTNSMIMDGLWPVKLHVDVIIKLPMRIEKGASVAVVVRRSWANLVGVRVFLRHNNSPEKEIRGSDDSHIITAKMLDSEDRNGLWIELNTEENRKDAAVKRASFFIPWNEVLSVVVAEGFSPAMRDEVRRMGF